MRRHGPELLRVIAVLDPRSYEKRALERWETAVLAELGGAKNVTAITRQILEQATRLTCELNRQDRVFFTCTRKSVTFHDTRHALRRQLSGILKMLGVTDPALGRTPRPNQAIPTLDDIAARYAGKTRKKRGRRKIAR